MLEREALKLPPHERALLADALLGSLDDEATHSRRCRTRRFPYGVFYSIHGDEVLISGVMTSGVIRIPGGHDLKASKKARNGLACSNYVWENGQTADWRIEMRRGAGSSL